MAREGAGSFEQLVVFGKLGGLNLLIFGFVSDYCLKGLKENIFTTYGKTEYIEELERINFVQYQSPTLLWCKVLQT